MVREVQTGCGTDRASESTRTLVPELAKSLVRLLQRHEHLTPLLTKHLRRLVVCATQQLEPLPQLLLLSALEDVGVGLAEVFNAHRVAGQGQLRFLELLVVGEGLKDLGVPCLKCA